MSIESIYFLNEADISNPSLEKHLAGKTVGDKLSVSVPPAEAYGERDERMVQELPASMFSGVDKIEAGMEFHAQTEQGTQIVKVSSVEGDTVTVDGNHPLEIGRASCRERVRK